MDSGEIDTLLVIGEDLASLGINTEQITKANLLFLGTQGNATSESANVLLPGLTVFEKNGSFVNLNFRLQKFQQAVPGPAGLIPDIMLLGKLLSTLTGNDTPTNINSVWEDLSSENPAFSGISFANIPTEGQELDGSAYTQLDFPETKSLKFEPVIA
jgi:NADH-quinone oxidoreductase subunit G